METKIKTLERNYIIHNFPYIKPWQLFTTITTTLQYNNNHILLLIKNNLTNKYKHIKYRLKINEPKRKFALIRLCNMLHIEIISTINKYCWNNNPTTVIIHTY